MTAFAFGLPFGVLGVAVGYAISARSSSRPTYLTARDARDLVLASSAALLGVAQARADGARPSLAHGSHRSPRSGAAPAGPALGVGVAVYGLAVRGGSPSCAPRSAPCAPAVAPPGPPRSSSPSQ